MYDKESEKKYISEVEIIFQVLEKDSGYESSRKVKEISFVKENFYQIKSDNLYKGEIEFDLESISYQVNIKIIDIKSRRVWSKSIDVDKNSSDLFSDIYFYNLDNDDNSYIFHNLLTGSKFKCPEHEFYQIKHEEALGMSDCV